MPARLLERDAPMTLAVEAATRAAGGEGAVLLLCAEAGGGKSSFIEALLARLAPQGLRVIVGACTDLGAARPLEPWHDIAARQLPALREVLAGDAMPQALADHLQRAAHDTPTLLVIEDLHWADEASLELLLLLGRRIAALPLLLLLSLRNDEMGDDSPLLRLLTGLPPSRLLRLELAALSAAAVAQLCHDAGRDARGVHALTGGNPYFVSELLASGVVDGWQGVPSSVRDAVQGRLRRLAPAQRSLLQRLSLMPGGCDTALALALLPEGAEPADLDGLVARGLLHERDARLLFRHELARRAVADPLPPLRRREHHAAILAALQAPPAGVAATPLAVLVHHAEGAGATETLLRLTPLAAREAAASGAHREAARLWKGLLPLAERLSLQQQAELHQAWSYEAGLAEGVDDAVIEARELAVTLWQQLGRADQVGLNLRWLARLHWYRGDLEQARLCAARAVTALDSVPSPLSRAWAHSARAQLALLHEQAHRAQAWARRAVRVAARLEARDVQSHALNLLGTAGVMLGDANACSHLRDSLSLALAGGFHEQAARSYATLATQALRDHALAQADTWLEEALAFGERFDLGGRDLPLRATLAELRLAQGRWQETEALITRLLARPRLSPFMRLPALSVRARLLQRRGDPQAAQALSDALQLAQAVGDAHQEGVLTLAQVEAAWLAGDTAQAARCLGGLPHPNAGWRDAWRLWRHRCGLPGDGAVRFPAVALELHGDAAGAARAWQDEGDLYAAALALLGSEAAAAPAALRQAAEWLDALGALPAQRALRRRAAALGMPLPRRRRGAQARTRKHPLGLTAREQQVLALLAQGLSNARIGAQLLLASRTVEHHVTAVLAKLGVASRSEAVARAWRDRLLG